MTQPCDEGDTRGPEMLGVLGCAFVLGLTGLALLCAISGLVWIWEMIR